MGNRIDGLAYEASKAAYVWIPAGRDEWQMLGPSPPRMSSMIALGRKGGSCALLSIVSDSLVPRPSASRARIVYVTFEPLSEKLAEGLVPLLRHLHVLKHCNMDTVMT